MTYLLNIPLEYRFKTIICKFFKAVKSFFKGFLREIITNQLPLFLISLPIIAFVTINNYCVSVTADSRPARLHSYYHK